MSSLPPSRARGALLGLAVGDALGTTLEFSEPRLPPFPARLTGPHTDIVGGGPFRLPAGAVTDDTHMACCLAASLRARGGFDPADLAPRYVAWSKLTFDIGGLTSAALRLLEGGARDAGRQVWERQGRHPAANGSLMRTAPIGVFFAGDAARRRAASFGDSALTHFDPRCQLACAVLNGAIADAPVDRELEEAAADLARAAPDVAPLVESARGDLREDLALARADDPLLDGLLHEKQGFVRVAFRLAFWELHHAADFRDGLIDVVNRGGDADTNGAIAGALLGAVHGEDAIPAAWRERVLAAPAPIGDLYHPRVLLA